MAQALSLHATHWPAARVHRVVPLPRLAGLRRWWQVRRTAAALHTLSDAELRDIGLHRGDIPGAALAVARGERFR